MSDNFRLLSQSLLSEDWGKLTKYDFELRLRDGSWQRQSREVYDRGNGATCLLHNLDRDTVLLTRQFRLPALLNGGLTELVETPAGLLEGAEPAERMRLELMEETGYAVSALTHLFDLYMSPGSVSEYLAFFTGEYRDADRVGDGGGDREEGEDIAVLEIGLSHALAMIEAGVIRDAKTVILLQRFALLRSASA
ncbi:NUDIX domain-containing protein [Martelella radicis]|uniref:GDP-mannose pyrophosphatase n=1 Tax=Martelella radicis TaxID=1397476 RepID=A0A7W6KML0_9HYPH|nr:NUDIX domain-containing protein [Martelella radicis]MBB4124063.1 nudix-type nucleoside diphosphatase (YffH/AdpP family) [Martelella radicis]